MRKMRELSKSHVGKDFLKNLLLRKLLVFLQTILSVSSEDLNKLTEMADKICKYTQVSIPFCIREGLNKRSLIS